MESDSVITYGLTSDQVNTICNHFNVNVQDVEDYEVCELLDKIIDNL